MVVVEDGRNRIGTTVEVLVTSILPTPAGRMIFARPSDYIPPAGADRPPYVDRSPSSIRGAYMDRTPSVGRGSRLESTRGVPKGDKPAEKASDAEATSSRRSRERI